MPYNPADWFNNPEYVFRRAKLARVRTGDEDDEGDEIVLTEPVEPTEYDHPDYAATLRHIGQVGYVVSAGHWRQDGEVHLLLRFEDGQEARAEMDEVEFLEPGQEG